MSVTMSIVQIPNFNSDFFTIIVFSYCNGIIKLDFRGSYLLLYDLRSSIVNQFTAFVINKYSIREPMTYEYI